MLSPASRAGTKRLHSSLAGLGGGAVDSGETFTRNGAATLDHFTGYDEFFDSFLRRQGVHRVKQQLLEDHHQAAGADLSLNSLPGDRLERILSKLQLDVVEIKLLLILLY